MRYLCRDCKLACAASSMGTRIPRLPSRVPKKTACLLACAFCSAGLIVCPGAAVGALSLNRTMRCTGDPT